MGKGTNLKEKKKERRVSKYWPEMRPDKWFNGGRRKL